jgi:hypothetical protein
VTDRSTVETVAIIGAGIGGLYLAAELGVAGFKSLMSRSPRGILSLPSSLSITLPIPICWHKRGKARQVDGAGAGGR